MDALFHFDKNQKECNIREPFDNFWIFYRFDKINENVDKKTKTKQTFKFYFVLILNLIFITNAAVLLIANDQASIKLFLLQFDFAIHLTPKPQLIYLVCICGQVFSILMSLHLNHSNCSVYKWFEIIDDFNKFEKFPKIGFNDKNLIDSYVKRIITLKKVLKISVKSIITFFVSIFIFLILQNFNLYHVHIWSVSLFIWSFVTLMFSSYYHFGFFYFYITCYNCKLRIQVINKSIKEKASKSIFIKRWKVYRLIRDINEIISDIDSYNQFWKRYILIVYYFFTPYNLITLAITISDTMSIIARSLALVLFISSIIMGQFFNLFISSLNTEFNTFYKYLHRFYAKNNTVLYLSLKYRLKNAMERCGEKRRLIGFSCGNQFIITKQMACTMIIMFIRFFLLTVKLSIKKEIM